MNIFRFFEEEFKTIVDEMKSAGSLPADLDTSRVVFELPREASHGDLACNAAMVLAKPAAMKPRDLAEAISAKIGGIAGVTAVEIAGPGFINIRVEPRLWAQEIDDIIAAGTDYGRNERCRPAGECGVCLQQIRPGPLHAAHARGAVLGDAMAGLLDFYGWNVTREYYINDAGAQVDTLALGPPQILRGAWKEHWRNSRRSLSGLLSRRSRREAGGGAWRGIS